MTEHLISISGGGWVSLPEPDGNGIEGCFLYRQVDMRDWAEPGFVGRRIVQLRGHEDTPEAHEADAVTFTATGEGLRKLARDLIEAGDRADFDLPRPWWAKLLFRTVFGALIAAVSFSVWIVS